MIIALAGVARSSRTAVQPLERMEAQSLDHTNRRTQGRLTGWNSVLSSSYNKRVNQLSSIGEHYMILKALSNGVSEHEISVSLSVDVETIRRKRSMLDGICPEVIELLTTRRVAV